jgi:hypothetical protein
MASPMRNIRNGSGLLFCPAPECLARRFTLNINAFAPSFRERYLSYAFDPEDAAEATLDAQAHDSLASGDFSFD